MEYLEGEENRDVSYKVHMLIERFKQQSERLKNDATLAKLKKDLREKQSFEDKIKFLESLAEDNLPACHILLRELLSEVGSNTIQYLRCMHLLQNVVMSMETFTHARTLVNKAYSTAKDLHQARSTRYLDSNFAVGEVYRAYFQTCVDCYYVYRFQGHLAEAKEYLDEAIKVAELEGDVEDLDLTTILHGDWLLAKGQLTKAIEEVFTPLLRKSNLTVENKGALLQKLGNCCRSAALWGRAKEHLRESILVARKLGDRVAEYDRTTDLGNVYRSEGRIADALDHQSRHMAFAFARGDKWGMTVASFNMGFAHYSLTPVPDMVKAQTLLTAQYILAQETENNPLSGIALNNLGKVYCALGQYETSVKLFKECVRIAKEVGNIAGEGMAYGNLGTSYRNLGLYEEAIRHHMMYKDNAIGRGDDGGVAIMQRELALDYLLNEDLENAEKQIKDCILTLESIRKALGSEDASRLANFDKNQAEAYNVLQVVLVKMGKFKECLAFSEFARGRAITDIIGQRTVKSYGKANQDWIWMDDAIISIGLDDRLSDSILKDFVQASKHLNASFLVYSVVTEYTATTKVHTEKCVYVWLVDARQENPICFRRVPIGTTISVNRLGGQLMDDERFFSSLARCFRKCNITETDMAIMNNNVDKTNSEGDRGRKLDDVDEYVPSPYPSTEIWNLLQTLGLVELADEKATVPSSDVPRTAEVSQTDTVTRQLSIQDENEYEVTRGSWQDEGQEQLQLLYSVCVEPIDDLLPISSEDSCERLIIMPQEFLFNVPFCSLRGPDGRYFIERFILSYAPSLRALLLLNVHLRRLRQCQGVRKLNVLSVGNPLMVERKLADLKYAEEEARLVYETFGKEQCTLAIREQATKKLVLQQLKEVDIIHLATHAYSEDISPTDEKSTVMKGDYLMRGCIVLSGSGEGECNGLLHAREIQSTPCKCQLVTLSCCETGLGKITGDGVIGLYRAFFAAGAAGVIVTLWKIRDDVTVDFMAKFYHRYKMCEDTAASLRYAMLHFIGEEWPPHQWAAFSFIGACGERRKDSNEPFPSL